MDHSLRGRESREDLRERCAHGVCGYYFILTSHGSDVVRGVGFEPTEFESFRKIKSPVIYLTGLRQTGIINSSTNLKKRARILNN